LSSFLIAEIISCSFNDLQALTSLQRKNLFDEHLLLPVAQALLPVQRQPQSQIVNADYNRPATNCHLSEAKNLNVPSLNSQPGSIKPSFRMIDLRTANPLTASD
jgi:hypothetical protein